jgi:hypothetical protein
MSTQAEVHVTVNSTTSSLDTRTHQTSATASSLHDQGKHIAEMFFSGRSHHPSKEEKRFIIGLDYGTTFTSVVGLQFLDAFPTTPDVLWEVNSPAMLWSKGIMEYCSNPKL